VTAERKKNGNWPEREREVMPSVKTQRSMANWEKVSLKVLVEEEAGKKVR